MTKRKTIDIQFLKETVNRRLAESTCAPEVRYGMISILETALHKTNNYHSYCYLDPVTKQPTCEVENVLDRSRRYYY
jgi:hypothetical protein